MPAELVPVFAALRSILEKHAGVFQVTQDTPQTYCLEAPPGAATLRSWGGKLKRPTIPVAWVHIGTAYVSYHLMGIYGNSKLLDHLSKELKVRMQGKSCFNFKAQDGAIFAELEEVTSDSLTAFCQAGFATTAQQPN